MPSIVNPAQRSHHARDKARTFLVQSSSFPLPQNFRQRMMRLTILSLAILALCGFFARGVAFKAQAQQGAVAQRLNIVGGSIQFSSASYSVNEGDLKATLNVTRTGDISNAGAAKVTIADVTTSPADYTNKPGAVDKRFTPGDVFKTVNIAPVIGDTLYETDENFTVNLSNPTLATINKSQGLISILNDDSLPAFHFSASSYVVDENAGNAIITVNRTGGTTIPATVFLATSDNTATGGFDYTATFKTLTSAPDETSKTVSIPITDDSINEINESLNLTLSGPTDARIDSPQRPS
jgi:hypothetical protein